MYQAILHYKDSEKIEVFNIFRLTIILFSVMIIYEYYFKAKPPAIIRVKDPKFSMLGPHNTTKYIVQDVYKQLIDIKDFKFTINTQSCKDTAGLLLMVIISSDPRNYDKRMAIRETWGRIEDSTKVVFLFGETDDAELSKKIVKESSFYNDVVQGNFKDAYRNMTYKHVMGLKWVVHHCPTAKYVLKTDDDVAIHIQYLRHFLARQLSPWGARDLILCPVHYHSAVVRWEGSKWKVLPSEFTAQYYPDYCFGWVIIYSQDVVYKLLETLQSLPYFWIDDVHVTGVAADKINVARTDIGSLSLDEQRTDLLITSGLKYVGEFLTGPAELEPSRVLKIMNAIYMSE